MFFVQQPPFIERYEIDGKSYFRGYCIDLINRIKETLSFEYTLYEVPDKTYGAINEQGEWNGLIRELITGVKTFDFQTNLTLNPNFFTGSGHSLGAVISDGRAGKLRRLYSPLLRFGGDDDFDAQTGPRIFLVQIHDRVGDSSLGLHHRGILFYQLFVVDF